MDPRTRETLAELLLAWEDEYRSGRDVPAAEVARDHPGLRDILDERIRALKATYWLDHPRALPVGDPDPSPPGRRLLGGRYRLDQRIAEGGFAEVWRAFDAELQRVVAIKIPKASRIALKESFLAEARRVARLRHPSIVAVHDVGFEGEECFIVSEFMDGGSLADHIARGPIERRQALRWIRQIAEAIDFAHRQGVTHRDVKPANILVNHLGDAVLADFGIAQSATKSEDFAPSVGTLRYMAPEQLTEGDVGPPADIYSLGIVLHEALAGVTPHSSGSQMAIRREATSTHGLPIAPSIPAPLAAICRRATHPDPTRRYPTSAAFVKDLGGCEWVRSPRTIRSGVAAIVACAVLAAAFLLAPAGRRAMPPPARGAATKPADPLRPADVVPATTPARLIDAVADSHTAEVLFAAIDESTAYIVDARNVALYREWQTPPKTYFGTRANNVECVVVYRFDFARAIRSARLLAASACWDFTAESGGQGRGVAALDVSGDGERWHAIRDTIAPRSWGEEWSTNETVPETVVGGKSLWVRIRLLSTDSPNLGYSVAQFGRDEVDFTGAVFGVVAHLSDAHEQREPRP